MATLAQLKQQTEAARSEYQREKELHEVTIANMQHLIAQHNAEIANLTKAMEGLRTDADAEVQQQYSAKLEQLRTLTATLAETKQQAALAEAHLGQLTSLAQAKQVEVSNFSLFA